MSLHSLELWLIFLLPWVLDAVSGRGVLASAFGAILWGMALVIALLRSGTRDERFKRAQSWALSFLIGAWLTYWLLSWAGTEPKNWTVTEETLRALTLLHAGILAAGVGMVAVHWGAALAWVLKESSLRKSSWARRTLRLERLTLPPLESIGRVCEGALRYAVMSWIFGIGLALVTASLRWGVEWVRDPKILISIILAMTLGASYKMTQWLEGRGRTLYTAYLTLSGVFLIGFSLLMSFDVSRIHEPLRWFVR